jgi:hypothetical protein
MQLSEKKTQLDRKGAMGANAPEREAVPEQGQGRPHPGTVMCDGPVFPGPTQPPSIAYLTKQERRRKEAAGS